jgi:ATP-dependent Zn protease
MLGPNWLRNSFVYVMIMVAVIAIVVVFFRPSSEDHEQRPISSAIADAKSGVVQSLVVKGDTLEVNLLDGTTYESRKEEGISVYTLLEANDVDTLQLVIDVKEDSKLGDWLSLVLNFLPVLIFATLVVALMGRTRQT